MSCGAATIDAWPLQATLRAVAGDPFAFRLVLRDQDGDVIDVTLWEWAATVAAVHVRLDFEWAASADGVRLWLRGDDTELLPVGKPCPFDVTVRQPSAGEGVTVVAGEMIVRSRVTEPLRYDPALAPGREEDLVPR